MNDVQRDITTYMSLKRQHQKQKQREALGDKDPMQIARSLQLLENVLPKRTGLNRMSEYQDAGGMITVINDLLDNRAKRGGQFGEEADKEEDGITLDNQNPNDIIKQEEFNLRNERIKVVEFFDQALQKNMNTASNNMSLLAIKSMGFQLQVEKIAQDCAIKWRLVSNIDSQIRQAKDSSQRLHDKLQAYL